MHCGLKRWQSRFRKPKSALPTFLPPNGFLRLAFRFRFGGEHLETYHRNMIRRWVLSLHKTVRKYFGEAVVVTQELDDIVSSPIIKDTIINNADCKILLDQRKYINKFDSVQSLLGLTDKEKGQILSINQSNDPARKYKEV